MKRLSVAGFILLTALSVQATSELTATLSGFKLELIDLDPLDGITPAFTTVFASSSGAAMVRLPNEFAQYERFYAASLFSPADRSISAGPLTSELQFSGADWNTFSMQSQVRSSLASVTFIPTESESDASIYMGFRLTPKTSLRFSALAALDAQASMLNGDHNVQVSTTEVRLNVNAGAGSETYNRDLLLAYRAPRDSFDFFSHQDTVLEFVYQNTLAQEAGGTIEVRTKAVQAIYSPVPEPRGAWTLAAGLTVFGCVARRGRWRRRDGPC